MKKGFRYKWSSNFILYLVLALASCSPNGGDGDNGESSTCKDYGQFEIGEYTITNDVWGKHNIDESESYQQCIWINGTERDLSFGWDWSWPTGNTKVKAYPSIVYGWKPWLENSTTASLPIRIEDINNLTVTYDTNISANGKYNVSFDLWLTSSPTSNESTITREVMIWVYRQEWDAREGESVMIDDEGYIFHKGSVSHGSWTFIAFYKEEPKLSGTINVEKFLNYLFIENHISTDEYLADVEFGTEIVEGSGQATITNYAVNTF